MNKLLVILAFVAASPIARADGYFLFSNVQQPSSIMLGPASVPGEGSIGDFPGGDYRISLYYEIGRFSGAVDPLALTLLPAAAAVPFFGTTGSAPDHGWYTDGAGNFELEDQILIPGTGAGTVISIETAAWYAGPGASSYQTSKNFGYNTGYSSLYQVTLVTAPNPHYQDLSDMPGFEVGIVPEPSTIALCGLGGAGLLLFRRRK